ncbi:MAG: DUF4268 domain-containing protein [Bacteroidetes bacterium]|nr:DUF4268 domain-containing protein [Bacteroidota bacterium]
MYIINKEANRIEKIETTTFRQLGFREREHLQEWIAHNPSVLNEDLLIIQKEFHGFEDTNERLDLLALDKQGNLVCIENKLDDTGKDVTWQVLKYASYCSTLTASQIVEIFQDYLKKHGDERKAEEVLAEYYDNEDFKERLNIGNSQRIIMIAGEFRKEVTSTVMWLLNYRLQIQCFKAIPYRLGDQLFLNMEQIIPIKDSEDFIISMGNKTLDTIKTNEELKERHILRREFWTEMLKSLNKVTSLYQKVSPSKDHWLNAGSGVSGVHYCCLATNYYCSIDLEITGGEQIEIKEIYDELYKRKNEVETVFGQSLLWERLDDKKMSRIRCSLENVDLFNREDWKKMLDFFVKNIPPFEKAFERIVKEVVKKVRKV